MDTHRLIELAPHYIVMFLLVSLALWIAREVVGEVGFWPEFAIIIAVVVAYRPVVVRLGIGPSGWE
jgi:hypothetical protein